ncbi:MAG: UMP kinase [Candidatus Riflebacteria bacterium]|nr:UMP kinase [Candidatus Riflebacteria bacterium]
MNKKFQFSKPLVKLSGEMLGGDSGTGFDKSSLENFSEMIAELVEKKITPSVVLGGGNLFRGGRNALPALKRFHGDYIGMLATVMNAICFADHLEKHVKTRVFSAVAMPGICESYQIDNVRKAVSDGYVCFFAGGTGNPFFSTDTAAALRAIETGCDVLIKATKVDGVYDSDPEKNPDAKKFETITYSEVLDKQLGVMDLMAIALCRENKLPLIVTSLAERGNLLKACIGDKIGTRVY